MLDRDTQNLRLISRVLTLYYEEDKNQAEVGRLLGLSTAKVSRLLKQARQDGLVEIIIRTPFQQSFAIERRLEQITGVQHAIVVPRLVDSPAAVLQATGRAAADYLLEQLRDGDTICLGGGRTLAAMVQELETGKAYPTVQVVPAIGGVQGRYYTDVNNLAVEMARRLGARPFQLHAPAFADTPAEKQLLTAFRQVDEILQLARRAQIAVMGVGSIRPETSSFFQFASISPDELQDIIQRELGVGEILARVITAAGELCAPELAARVVGIDVEDLRYIPLTIGVAALEDKAKPIAAALRGRYLKTIITDEVTAQAVCDAYIA